MGIVPKMCNDIGVCSVRQKEVLRRQRTHNVCRGSSVFVSNTDRDGMRYNRYFNVNFVRTLDIYYQSIHSCATVPTTSQFNDIKPPVRTLVSCRGTR